METNIGIKTQKNTWVPPIPVPPIPADIDKKIVVQEKLAHEQWINFLGMNSDDTLLVSACEDRTVRLWKTEDMSPLLVLPVKASGLTADFSPDKKYIAYGDYNDILIYPLDFSQLERDPKEILQETQQQAGVILNGFEIQPVSEVKK